MTRTAVLAALLCSAASAQPTASRAASLDGASSIADARPDLGAYGVLADTTSSPPDDWIARDKAMHLGASFLLTLSAQYVLTDKTALSEARAVPIAAGSALAVGLVKEIADSQRRRAPHFSWRDLAVDAIGVALGVALIEL